MELRVDPQCVVGPTERCSHRVWDMGCKYCCVSGVGYGVSSMEYGVCGLGYEPSVLKEYDDDPAQTNAQQPRTVPAFSATQQRSLKGSQKFTKRFTKCHRHVGYGTVSLKKSSKSYQRRPPTHCYPNLSSISRPPINSITSPHTKPITYQLPAAPFLLTLTLS